jgi:hypothetical protein
LTDPYSAAWSAATLLLQNQIDFIYIDEGALGQASIEAGRLVIGAHRFRAVICDPPRPAADDGLAAFANAGGLTLANWQPETLIGALDAGLGRDVDWPAAPDLRALHYRKQGRDFYFLVNEGEQAIEGDLSLAATGALECWDPLDGSAQPWPSTTVGGRTYTHLRLDRRQGLVVALDRLGQAEAAAPPSLPGDTLLDIAGPWRAYDEAGSALDLPCPGDWAQLPGWEIFSGRLRFRTEFALTLDQAQAPLFLDLGQVGDIAEVILNGASLGGRAWAPYIWPIGQLCRAGDNQLEVVVTNSIANQLEGLQRPSGLLGPVCVRRAAR